MIQRGLTPKALLLLDNAPAHPDSSVLVSRDKSITAMFLPPNTTALIQPMDQGVLEALKRRYRRSVLQKILLEDEAGQFVIQCIKNIDIKDVVYMSAAAWDDIPALTLTRSWNKLLARETVAESDQQPEDMIVDTHEESIEALAKKIDPSLSDEDITNWMQQDSSDPGYQLMSDDEIIQQVTDPSPEEGADMDDDEDSAEQTTTISSGQAAEMLEQCLKW